MPNFGWNRFKFARASVTATAPQILQPLQGSGEQVAPPTTCSSQASLASGTTAGGDNASQSSSQENATGLSVSNDPIVTLVFSCNILVSYSGCSLLLFFFLLLNVTIPRLCFFYYAAASFSFSTWSTWSVIYSVGLAMSCFSCLSLERTMGRYTSV